MQHSAFRNGRTEGNKEKSKGEEATPKNRHPKICPQNGRTEGNKEKSKGEEATPKNRHPKICLQKWQNRRKQRKK